jgi:ketosteroid isomerase-like protein
VRRELILAAGVLAAGLLLVRERRRRSPDVLVRKYFEAWEEGNPDPLDDVLDDDYSGHVNALGGTEERNRETLAEQLEAHARVFAERHYEVEDTVASGDEVAARVHMRATHAETDREAEMDGLVFFRLDNGRIAEEWASWDYLGLARQLGLDGASDS